jgi:formylglycine-generating enzyme required for sulfatase activity
LSWQEKVQRLNHSSIKRTSGGNGYRLPTDLEWEYAAKADGSSLYAGGSTLDTVAWYVENSGNKSELKPVGEKQSNGFGLFDMSGGVYEWVWDWEADYPMDSQELINPTGVLNRSNEKIVRGGSVFSKREALEISEYETQFPDTIDFVTGFRVVQNECQIKSP